MSLVSEAIDEKIGKVRTDAFDLSFGEIVNLHREKELIIQPAYQRLFRWSIEQRSRLIESILLELPIPQIFVIENETGVFELIDGLQRVSSVLNFVDPQSIKLDPLRLDGCELVTELNGSIYEDLPLGLRLRIKRSSVRTVVIKRQSRSFLRYEMFKRLNTGGSYLSAQEIRNCSSRMVGATGERLYVFLQELSQHPSFKITTDTISQTSLEQRGDEELVLRFLTAKNSQLSYKGNIQEWLDTYMENILFEKVSFNFEKEKHEFTQTFDFINEFMGSEAFVKYRGDTPVGGLAPAYYEAVTMAVFRSFDEIYQKPKSTLRAAVIATLQSTDFRSYTGPGANSKEKLANRIKIVQVALIAA